ncbi:tRNA ligase [Orobanche gracilis]
MSFSAFDALMSGARAAAKRKHPPLPSSPQKYRKPPNSPSLLVLSENPNNLKSPETLQQSPAEIIAKRGPPNKVRLETSELKERVSWLNKKPSQFNPNSICWWEKGEPVPFLFLSMTLDMIDKESGRITITDILCNLLRTVIHTTPEDLVLVVYLSAGRIAPPHQGVELGIGEASIIKALAEACGRTESHIKKQLKVEGDLGLVAKASRLSQSLLRKPDALTIRKVFNTFHLIAELESGKDSQEKKKNQIKSLLLAATDCEPLYLVRLLQTKLRIGCAEQTLLAALGQAAVYTEEHSKPPPKIQSPLEEAAKIVKQVYSILPDYDKIVSALLRNGIWLLPKTCNFTPGVPVGPMLSKAITGASEALKKFQDVEFTCEYKYDGERAQIHYMENGSVEIYSRNAERNTAKFPDIVDAVSRLKKPTVSSFVLDCELVAYDRAKQKILPFQVLSTRARKNVAVSDIKVDVCIFAFDLLYHNGETLFQENLKVRREHLHASFEEESGFLQFATSMTSNDPEEIHKFLDKAIDASCEGLIIKTLNEDSTYEPSQRSLNWLKLKKDYLENIGDTLDLVPIGAFYGKGKRRGVYGAFLLACYDRDNEEFQTICKTGTGFSDEMLEECFARLRSIPKAEAYYRHAAEIEPDVWIEASESRTVLLNKETRNPRKIASPTTWWFVIRSPTDCRTIEMYTTLPQWLNCSHKKRGRGIRCCSLNPNCMQ